MNFLKMFAHGLIVVITISTSLAEDKTYTTFQVKLMREHEVLNKMINKINWIVNTLSFMSQKQDDGSLKVFPGLDSGASEDETSYTCYQLGHISSALTALDEMYDQDTLEHIENKLVNATLVKYYIPTVCEYKEFRKNSSLDFFRKKISATEPLLISLRNDLQERDDFVVHILSKPN